MPSPYIMCMEVLEVAKGEKIYDSGLERERKEIEE